MDDKKTKMLTNIINMYIIHFRMMPTMNMNFKDIVLNKKCIYLVLKIFSYS